MSRLGAVIVAALVAMATVPGGVGGVAAGPAHAGDGGQALNFTQQNNTSDSGPDADISVPSDIVVGERVVLDGSGSTGENLDYRWEFENGGAWYEEKHPHRFARSGEREVTLTVTEPDGDSDTATVTIDPREPNDGNGLDASLSLSKQEVQVGEIFTMDASGTTPGSDIVGFWYSDDDDMQHEQKNQGDSIPVCVDDGPGEYTLHVWAVEEGSVDRASATITVTGDGPTDGCTGGSGGSGSSGGDGDTTDYDFDPTVVDVERADDGSVHVDADEVEAGENVTVVLTATGNDTGVSFGNLVVELAEKNSFTLDAQASTTAPNGTTAPAVNTTGFEPVGYLTVETSDLDSEALGNGTVTFTVDGQRLVDADATPDDVALYRLQNGTWNEVDATTADWDTSQNVSANATYAFETSMDEFSTFAIGVDRTHITVTDLAVGERGLRVGDTAKFTAVVRNDGAANGTATVSFQLGDDVRNRTVEVAANETKRLTFVKRVAEPGEHAVSVGGQTVHLWVEQQQQTTTSTTPDTTSTPTPTTSSTNGDTDATTTPPVTSDGQPGFGVAVALLAFAGAALLARRS